MKLFSASNISRRGVLALVTVSGLSACSQPTEQEKIANDPYLPQLRAEAMYGWMVGGADRQTPAETLFDINDQVEVRHAIITIYHTVHPDADADALYNLAIAARKDAGYDQDNYRINSQGLSIKCEIATVPSKRSLLLALYAPEG